jgi:hypothetical protein
MNVSERLVVSAENEEHGDGFVGAGGHEGCSGADFRQGAIREQRKGPSEGIDADCTGQSSSGITVTRTVKQYAAAQVHVHQTMAVTELVLIRIGAHVRKHSPDGAQLAGLQDLLDGLRDRQKSRPHCFHQVQLLLLGQIVQDLCLLCVDGEGFLAQHVLAFVQTLLDVREVVRMRRRNVDDVYVWVA